MLLDIKKWAFFIKNWHQFYTSFSPTAVFGMLPLYKNQQLERNYKYFSEKTTLIMEMASSLYFIQTGLCP
jgi:hypothetical protein